MTENADNLEMLAPVEERIVHFYDDDLIAVRVEDGTIFVPVRRLCDNLGLSWSGQYERIQRDEVLSEELRSVRVGRADSETTRGHEEQAMVCLPLRFIPGWLFGISASRVKEEIREKLMRYRRECFDVLWDAFKADMLPAMDAALTLSPKEMTPAEQALATIEALYALAKQQVALEQQLARHDAEILHAHTRLDKAARMAGDHERRISRIEFSIKGGETVTDAQAAAISDAVKALAFELGKSDPKARNPYQQVYGEMYRRFRVPGYTRVPMKDFPAVMQWLTDWWRRLTDEEAPFGGGGEASGK